MALSERGRHRPARRLISSRIAALTPAVRSPARCQPGQTATRPPSRKSRDLGIYPPRRQPDDGVFGDRRPSCDDPLSENTRSTTAMPTDPGADRLTTRPNSFPPHAARSYRSLEQPSIPSRTCNGRVQPCGAHQDDALTLDGLRPPGTSRSSAGDCERGKYVDLASHPTS